MKLTKSLFMLCAAGLSLCACNSDDIKDQMPEGYGAVTVKIADPSTRAVIDAASEGGTVNGDITLTVTHNFGTSSVVLTYNTSTKKYSVGSSSKTVGEKDGEVSADLDGSLAYVFYGIGAPSKITASMYGGQQSYNDVNITTMQQMPNVIPVYGEVTSFGTGADIIKGDVTYKNYTAAITMTIPVARLEVNVQVGEMSDFKSVELLGVYLDKVKPTADDAAVNYFLKGDQSNTKQATNSGDAAHAILCDPYLADDGSYDDTKSLKLTGMTPSTYLPAETKYFAYNFYAGTNPEFKLLLKVTQQDGQASIPQYQYAIIKEYKNGVNTVTFENQNIYKVNIVLNDQNIQIDEEGAAIEYALTATVTKAKWTVIPVTADWAQ
jgi:hypothetical protein